MSYSGVEVSAWVKIESDCDIEYTLCGDTVELNLGGYSNGFQVDATKRGLEKLVQVGSEALNELRAAEK